MSFTLPGAPPPSRRVTAPTNEQLRAKQEEEAQHLQLRNELHGICEKQGDRIEKLKLDTAVQLEHHATLRRQQLEQRKANALEALANLTPRLEVVRSQWSASKQKNQGYEVQWGSMRTQFQQVKQRVDAAKDQINDGRDTIETTRKTLQQMREHLHKLERDKSSLRAKMKRALECLVIDDNFLNTRVKEEEQYQQQVQQAMSAMEREYQDTQSQYQHEFAPLEEDLRLLTNHLEEMQARTKDLQKYCVSLEGKTSSIDEHWIESVHSVFETLERAKQIDQLKNTLLSYLEHQIEEHRRADVVPRTRAGHMDRYWLTNAVAVWENVVKLISQERQKMQIKDDKSQFLAETSQKAQQAKGLLQNVKNKVEGTAGPRRNQLFQEIGDMHYLILEKKESEEQMVKYVQEVATQLQEDLSQVLHLLRKDGYDDYVSSTDGEDDGDEENNNNNAAGDEFGEDGLGPMREEGDEDISNIVSSIDLDPDDPAGMDALKRMAHRKEGPLKHFAAKRAQYLQKHAKMPSGMRGGGGGVDKQRQQQRSAAKETLDRSLMDVQVRVANDVISYVRQRQQQIQQGLLDPAQERMQPEPKYVQRVRDTGARVEKWVEQQKDNPMGPSGSISPTPSGQ